MMTRLEFTHDIERACYVVRCCVRNRLEQHVSNAEERRRDNYARCWVGLPGEQGAHCTDRSGICQRGAAELVNDDPRGHGSLSHPSLRESGSLHASMLSCTCSSLRIPAS